MAEHTLSSTSPAQRLGRRATVGTLLAGGASAAGIMAGTAALAADRAPTLPSPDAELIALCREHVANLRALNTQGDLADDGCPLWAAYVGTKAAISAAKPLTLAGLVAKASVAEAERSLDPDGEPELTSSVGEDWAWDLVNDIIRIGGRA